MNDLVSRVVEADARMRALQAELTVLLAEAYRLAEAEGDWPFKPAPSEDDDAGAEGHYADSIAISVIRDHAARDGKLRGLDKPWMSKGSSTAMGEAMRKIMATLAQLRVDLSRENTRRNVEHARSQGRIGGRPAVMTPERDAMAKTMREDDENRSEVGDRLRIFITYSDLRPLSFP
ncbi:hypothetical protein ACXR2W_10490 [Leucobacter sp. HY1908]